MNQLTDLQGLFNCLRPDPPEGYGAFDRTEDAGPREINLTKIDNIVFGGIDKKDYPDFCDVFVQSADMHGYPMTNEELDDLNDNYPEWVHERLIESLH